jgi:hypothetical protein
MLTIQEWAKLNPQPLALGVVEVIANNNPILGALPFINIAGNAYRYNAEETLPGIAFRDFNQGYTESTGVVNPMTESLTIIGGDSDFDIAEIAMQSSSNDVRAIHDAMKAKALALTWLQTFFTGDTATNPLAFDGLDKRLVGAQVITSGGSSAANGSALRLDDLDALVDAVIGTPDLLVMNKSMRAQVRKLARESPSLRVQTNQFGQEVTSYGGVTIAIVETGADGNLILGANETLGTSTNCSSIYAVSFGPDKLVGLQTAPLSARDLGEVQDKPAFRTRIEWYSGIALKHPRACSRLKGVLPFGS